MIKRNAYVRGENQMVTNNCGTCIWNEQGTCRLNPPQVVFVGLSSNGLQHNSPETVWPTVRPNDNCSHHVAAGEDPYSGMAVSIAKTLILYIEDQRSIVST